MFIIHIDAWPRNLPGIDDFVLATIFSIATIAQTLMIELTTLLIAPSLPSPISGKNVDNISLGIVEPGRIHQNQAEPAVAQG
jgi:hypothetical protein